MRQHSKYSQHRLPKCNFEYKLKMPVSQFSKTSSTGQRQWNWLGVLYWAEFFQSGYSAKQPTLSDLHNHQPPPSPPPSQPPSKPTPLLPQTRKNYDFLSFGVCTFFISEHVERPPQPYSCSLVKQKQSEMSVVPGECYIFTNLPSTAYKGWGLVFIVSGENHQDPTFQRCTLHSLSQSLPLWLVSLTRP